MKILGLDTSNKFIIISLMEEYKEVYFKKINVYRNASELTNLEIDKAFKEVGWKPKELESVVVTKGPGSFTGVRIAMSIAKVLTTTLSIPLYTISSLKFYAGLKSAAVILDARSNKVYYGNFEKGKTVKEEMIQIKDIENQKVFPSIGELSIIDKEDNFNLLENNFIDLKEFWIKESSLEAKPQYFKSNL